MSQFDHRRLFVACLLALGLSGCTKAGVSRDETPPPKAQPADTTPSAPAPTLADDFEGDAVAKFWLGGDYGMGRFVPGAIAISDKFAHGGKHSVAITIHENDVAQKGDADSDVERDELDSGHFPLLGEEAWYRFAMLVPEDFPIVDVRLVVSSCKQTDVPRPILAQRFRNGRHTFTVESQGRKETYRLPALKLGKWSDFVYHVRYSAGKDGLIQVWMDGKKVVDYTGSTAEPGYRNAFYHKVGLYRDRMKQPMTIYFDDYAMGGAARAIGTADLVRPTR